MARAWSFVALFVLFVLCPLDARAATVKSGTIESVSTTSNTITVKFAHSDKATEIRVMSEAKIRLDDKSLELSALQPGMSVTIELGDDGQAERIIARIVKDKPTRPAAVPKTAKKTSTPRKSSKTASKSAKKKSESDEADTGKSPGDSVPFIKRPSGTASVTKMNPPATSASQPVSSSSGSWPSFLGPNRDNISAETGLLQSWPRGGPALAWKTQGLGVGYSTVSISDGKVFTMGTPDDQESVLAIDLETGKALWSVPTNGQIFQEASGNGPRSTPTIDNGRAYALGATGQLVCVDIRSKSVHWQKNIAQEFGVSGMRYGFSESVLIDGPHLICTPGGQMATVVALDKETGAVVWKSQVPGNPGAAYASPLLVSAGGTRQYVVYLSTGLVGIRAQDGQPLWGNDDTGKVPANCTTPIAFQDMLFVSSAYGGGGDLLKLVSSQQGVQANVVYHTREMNSHHGGLVALKGYLYGASDEILTCLSLEDGRAVWKNRSVGKCSLTYADGRLYVRSESGPMALVDASPEGYHEAGRFSPPRNTTAPAWPYPVVAGGRLFLRDQDDLLCYSLRASK